MADYESVAEAESAAGGGGGELWELVKEWDFTAQGDFTFVNNTVRNIESIPFIPRNLDRSSEFELGSSGLKIAADGTEARGVWYSYLQQAPVLYVALTDLYPGYDLEDTICVQVLWEPSVDFVQASDAQYQYMGAGLTLSDGGYGGIPERYTTGGGNWVASICYNPITTTEHIGYARYGGGTGNGDGDPIATYSFGTEWPTFAELIFYPATGFSTGLSTDTSFQEPQAVTTARFYGSMELKKPIDIGAYGGNTSPGTNPDFTLRPSNLHIGLYFAYTTEPEAKPRSSQGHCLFKKLRVLKRTLS